MKTMLSQTKILVRMELCNIFGLNVMRFSKDKKRKRKTVLLAPVYILLALIMIFYVGMFSFGLCMLSLEEVVPAYLITISSLLIFFFGIFKAGGAMFKNEGYDIISSLPVSQGAIVISRFFRLYVENLLFSLGVLLPGLAVYVRFANPGALFYLFALLGSLLVPILPTVGAVFVGALITAIASRLRHKSLIVSGLSVLTVLVCLVGSFRFSATAGEINPEMLKELSAVVFSILEKVYPPAVWLGRAMVYGMFGKLFLCMAFSTGVLFGVIVLISGYFYKICQGLYGITAKHDYQMGNLKRDSVGKALVKRELKRYFSSGTYVTNTIIGPVMGVVFAVAVLVVGTEKAAAFFPFPVEIGRYIPYVLAGIFCMMNTTCVSISMEGKNWWIINSLPLSTKAVLDAKLSMNLVLILPFYLMAEVMLVLALGPGFLELIWLLLIPAVAILFSCVFGLTVNLHFPVFTWESEVSVVKQSASSMLGGMGGMLLVLLFITVNAVASDGNAHLINAVCCAVTFLAAGFLYGRNNRVKLQEL